MLITVIYQEKKKNPCEREGNLVPENACLFVPPIAAGVRAGSQAGDISGWRTGGLNNSQVSDTQKNYGWLTYAGINPASLLMAKRCVFKCHKNSAFFPPNTLL